MTKIHHATAARAAKLGATVEEMAVGGFQLIRTEDGARSADAWNTAKEAVQALADAEDEFEWEEIEAEDEGDEEEGGPRSKSGVMPIDYHRQYTLNGGGCGDTLDTTLRTAFLTVVVEGQKDKAMDMEAFRAYAEATSVWKREWAGLNNGMLRMNFANRVRAFLRNDETASFPHPTDDTSTRFGIGFAPRKPRKSRAKTKKGA